jgi:hypothetical protein
VTPARASSQRASASEGRRGGTNRNALLGFALTAIALEVVGLIYDRGLALAVPVCLPLVIFSVWLCARLDRGEHIGIAELFLLALILRWVVAAGVDLVVYRDHPLLFAPDEGTYHEHAEELARQMAGKPSYLVHPPRSGWGLVRTTATCFYLFGVHRIVPKFLNCTLGAWTAVMTALLAIRLFPSRDTARRAGILAAVFPSLVLWSSLLLKDIWTLLGAQVVLVCFLHLRERFRLPVLGALLFGLLLIGVNRPYEVIFVALSLGASFAFGSSRHMVRNLVLFVLLAAVLTFAVAKTGALTEAFGTHGTPVLDRVAALRRTYTLRAGSAIDTSLVDTSTTLGLLKWLPLGVLFFFLAPIPFTGRSALSLASSPEVLLWYALLPSAVRSLRSLLRGTNKAFWPVLLYVIFSSVSWGAAITNVGTMYRYRAQVLFFPLILIAADQIRRRDGRRRARAAEQRALAAARRGRAREAEDG